MAAATFQTPSSDLEEGSYSLTVTATDAAGNVSATSGAVSKRRQTAQSI